MSFPAPSRKDGKSPARVRYSGFQNFERCRTPESQRIVTTEPPGGTSPALTAFTTPTQFKQAEDPTKRPSWCRSHFTE